jgi:hypothetical protein
MFFRFQEQGAAPLKSAFRRRPSALYNPLSREARMKLAATMAEFLKRLGWEIRFVSAGGSNFSLKPGVRKEIFLDIKEGKEFTREMVLASGSDNIITITVTADNIVIGGMSFHVDPSMKESNVHRIPDGRAASDIASELLKCVKSEKAKKIHIRKVVVEIDFDDECR